MTGIPSTILGLSFGHGDSSAALIVNGQLVAAVEEERLNRIKHYAFFPKKSIEYCLNHAGLKPQDVQVIALPRNRLNQLEKRLATLIAYPQLLNRKGFRTDSNDAPFSRQLSEMGFTHAHYVYVEHHLAHMMSSRFLPKENAFALLSFDGLGDFVSTAIGKCESNAVEILERVTFPHSLGHFYNAITLYMGFHHFGEEFKVMGLSSFGKPTYATAFKELVREREPWGFELNLEAFPPVANAKSMCIENAQPRIMPFYNANILTQMFGLAPRRPTDPLTQKHSDLAKSLQVRFGEIATHLLHQLHKRFPSDTLALSGGCSHNSVWVGTIPQKTPFKKIHVAPASHDAGLSVGAAIFAAKNKVVPEGKDWACLGPSAKEFAKGSNPTQLPERKFKTQEQLITFLVDQLAEEKIIGLFHGRMEFGPRALGNRSIICDPRKAAMKEKLNDRVKHREKFRPFAVSVLWDYQDEWFPGSFYSPTMEAVFPVKESLKNKIAAAVHVDHTCRIQSIRKDNHSFYYRLIEAFRKKTGIPMLINTSFNDCEPIVCTEEDAFSCFSHCDMDYLVIEDRVYFSDSSSVAQSA